jgi:hypothetical protein
LTFDSKADEACLVTTHRAPSHHTLREYRKRFGCEPFFSDLKKRGFDMSHSQLRHRDRSARLLLVLALLGVWLIGVGQQLTMRRRARDCGMNTWA